MPGSLIAAGFDAAVLEELPPQVRGRLARVAILRRLAYVAIALAVGIAAHISVHGGWVGWTVGFLLALGTWFLFTGMGRLLISAGGPGVARGTAAAKAWRPGVVWPTFLFLAAALATQPLLLGVGWGGTARRVGAVIDDRVALHLSRQRDVLVAADDRLQLQRAELSERLAAGGTPLPEGTKRRKALVIGAQRYAHVGVLNNPAKDARDLTAKLTAMGFAVISSIDEPADSLLLKIERHIGSLEPGDISVVAYSGHGYQNEGHNYIVPVDFDGQRVGGLRVTRILEAITRRSPQMQVIILDACRSFVSDAFRVSTGGLAELQGGANSVIAMAAQPGKEALDGEPGSNGLFTAAILRHIDAPVSISTVFTRVNADVDSAARLRNFVQTPLFSSTLQREDLQLVDPAIAGRALPAVGADVVADSAGGVDAGADTVAMRATAAPAICPPPPGLAPEAQQAQMRDCLLRRIAAIDTLLVRWRQVGTAQLTTNGESYRRALRGSGLLRERVSDMWTVAPVALAFASLLIAGFLCAGEYFNRLDREDLASYFERRNHRAVQQLERHQSRTEGFIARRLAAARHPSYLEIERFRAPFDWKGPVAQPPVWAGDVPTPTRAQRAAIDGWLEAMGRRPEGA